MKLTTERLKQLIKEQIEEARLVPGGPTGMSEIEEIISITMYQELDAQVAGQDTMSATKVILDELEKAGYVIVKK